MQNYWILNSTKSLKSTSIKAWNSGSIPHCPEASSCSKRAIESLEQNIAYGWTIYLSSSVHTSPSILHTPLWTLFNGPWNIFDPRGWVRATRLAKDYRKSGSSDSNIFTSAVSTKLTQMDPWLPPRNLNFQH